MNLLTILTFLGVIAMVLGGGPIFSPSKEPEESLAPGTCPNCATGQLNNSLDFGFAEYRQKNCDAKKNAPTDGKCTGNREKRIFDGSLCKPAVANICCCEPTNSPFYDKFPPTGAPQ